MRPGTELVASKCLLSSQFSESPGVGPGMQLEPKKCVDLSPLLQESPSVGLGLGGQLLTHSLLPVPVMAPFCPQRHERQAQHRYQQQQRRRREEEERQRHAEHHARRERERTLSLLGSWWHPAPGQHLGTVICQRAGHCSVWGQGHSRCFLEAQPVPRSPESCRAGQGAHRHQPVEPPMCVCSAAQCPTFCDTMGWGPQSSSVH